MRRPSLNFLINIAAFVAFIFMVATGAILRFRLPPGSGGGEGWRPHPVIWGLGRHDWGGVHFWISIVLLSLLSLHLVLHWDWIVCMVKGKQAEKSGSRLVVGFTALAILLSLVLLLVSGSKKMQMP